MKEKEIDIDFLENLILKTVLTDRDFLVLVVDKFEGRYFDNSSIGDIFEYIRYFTEENNQAPDDEIIINSLKNKEEIRKTITKARELQIDIPKHYDFIINKTNTV